MPFKCRIVEPINLTRKRKHQFKSNRVFSEFEEVSNHALVGVLMQLSSLTYYAEEIFGGIHTGVSKIQRRCSKIEDRICNIQDRLCDESDSEDDDFVTPDIDRDRTLEAYLHYQSPNALEEDLFTKDTRNPSIIRLHQKAAQDLNYLLRGSQAYAKNRRPKSFDPNVLLDDFVDSSLNVKRKHRNSTFLSSTTQLNNSKVENHSLPTPEEKMKLDSSDSMADVIKIDTSGSKYDRQASARKSLRTGSCSVRQKPATHRMFRQRNKTLSGVPGHPANESELSQKSTNYGDHVTPYLTVEVEDKSPTIINGHAITPRENLRNAEMQTEDVEVIPISAAQRRLRSRGSSKSNRSNDHLDIPIPVQCPSVNSDSMSQSTDEISRPGSLSVPGSLPTSAFNTPCSLNARTPASPHSDAGVAMVHHNNNVHSDASPQHNGDQQFMRTNDAKRLQQVEDRTSSGFWSGTESTRHSSASEIMQQHNHVTQALQQILKNPRPTSPPDSAISVSTVVPTSEADEIEGSKLPSWYASSVASSSVNSRLSTLDRSSPCSIRADDENRYKSSDSSSVISQRIEQALGHPEGRKKKSLSPRINNYDDSTSVVSPRALLKKKAKGGEYGFMNSVEEDLNKTPIRKTSRFSFKGRKSSKKAKPVESPSSVILERKFIPSQNGIVAMSECSYRSEDSGSLVPGDSIINGMSVSQAVSVCSMEEGTPLKNSTRNDGCETPTPSEKGFSVQPSAATQQTSTPNYYSYQRAIKTNNEVTKTLTDRANNSRSDSSSTGTVSPLVTTPQTNKKKGPKPPPPKRNSSLSVPSPTVTRKANLPTVAEDKNTTNSSRSPISPVNGGNFMNELASVIKSSQSLRKNKTTPKNNKDKVISNDEESDKPKLIDSKLSSKYPEMAYMEPLRSTNNNNNAGVVEETKAEKVVMEKTTEKKSRPPPPPKPVRTSSIRTPSSGPTAPKKTETKEASPARKTTSPAYFSTAHNWGKIPESTSIRHVGFKANKSPAAHQSVELVKTPTSANRRGSDDVFLNPETPKSLASVGDDVPDGAKVMKKSKLVEKVEAEVVEKTKEAVKAPEVKKKPPPQVKPKPSISLKNASARAAFFSSSFETPAEEDISEKQDVKIVKLETKVEEKQPEKVEEAVKEKVSPAVESSTQGEVRPLEDAKEDNREVTGSKDDEELLKETESNMSELLKLESSSSPVSTNKRPSSSLKINIPTDHRQLSSPVNANSAVARLLGNTGSLRTKKSASYNRSKSLNSPPISPGVKDGMSSPGSSPMSTLERRKNKRLSNTVGRPSSRTTSRDDFKSLLLQSATKNTGDGRMSATEKLLLTKNRPKSEVMSASTMPRIGKASSLDMSTSKEDHLQLTPRNGIASISDIRSLRVGRPYKKVAPKSSLAESLNGKATIAHLSLHGNQPPVSLSGKYNSKRSRTPTRLMMSISEDNELEKSPETTARAESD